MGHSKQSKEQHHAQIVAIAAKRFKENGLEGLSISQLMQEAGLTHGGFYKHFASREDLVVQAVECALSASRAKLSDPTLSYPAFVQTYLSPTHRDAVGDGCALAALASDVARAQAATKRLYTEQLTHTLARLQHLLGDEDNSQAIVAFSALTGALAMARAVDDEQLALQILEVARTYTLQTSDKHLDPL